MVFVSKINGLGNVKCGQVIGEVIEPITGKMLQEFVSPKDGFVFTLREHPVIYKGDIIARVHGGLHG